MGGMSLDIPTEAKVLVKRMTSDPHVKINEHWKVCCNLLLQRFRLVNFIAMIYKS